MIRFPKPGADEYAAYYAPYLASLADDKRDVMTILRSQGLAVLEGLKRISDAQAEHRYAPGKWSVKELIGHLIDTERLFAFRALWFARGETASQPGMDENTWAANSNAGARSRQDLWKEHHVTRTNHLYLFRSLDVAAVARRGTANGATMTVSAVPWVMAGHELHHLQVLRDRYGVDFLGEANDQEQV
jgi:hypothetical protein